MGKKEVLIKSDEPKAREQVAAFLRELADKVEAGEVTLQQGEQEVAFSLPPIVELEVEVEQKEKKRGTKYSLEIEIEWMNGVPGGESLTLG